MVKTDEPPVGVPVFSPRTANEVRKMLALAAGPGGTGQRAQTIGYSVGGKSGTARKQQGKGYAAGKYRAWFTGMAPIENPRFEPCQSAASTPVRRRHTCHKNVTSET